MTRELIIEGERMDLAPDTNVTLEYVSNMVGDIGKINFSHSYTIKLPRTVRNAKILDAPDFPGHASQRTRRFLSAHFIQNGVDLIGPAQAYILQTTPEAYELALVWNALESLQALSESAATINDLPDLPVLRWISSDRIHPDYNDTENTEGTTGAFFATYNSGLSHYALVPEQIRTAPHPCMRVSSLLSRILNNADVSYTLSSKAMAAIGRTVVLAAPGHKPNRQMEISSGNEASYIWLLENVYNNVPYQYLALGGWGQGWDALKVYGDIPEQTAGYKVGAVLGIGEETDVHILLNLRMPAALVGASVIIEGLLYDNNMNNVIERETIYTAFVKSDEIGGYLFVDEDLKFSGWQCCAISLQYDGPEMFTEELTAYDASLPRAAVYHIHDTIDLTKDNRFPIEGNLPDIKQWDFVKAVMAFFGLASVIKGGVLYFYTYEEILNTIEAYDWTHKVDMTNGGAEVLKYTLDGWARRNQITFKENPDLNADPTANLIVEDATIPESRKWFELPFAASKESTAVHYEVTAAEDGTLTVKDVDIEPRIFDVDLTRLVFRDYMQGQGLINARYGKLQNIARTPVVLSVSMRLHEVDLARLDLSCPVYLSQFGQYYGILKIQTGSDLCKVELIQLT